MTITRKIVLDEQGVPAEVIIPYAQFLEIVEALGLDLDAAEQRDLRDALEDSTCGRRDAFVSADMV
ncbi:MAG: hypothetical protein NTW21_25950 [Verrucomicrobia bacterium]|nr:hypothetical protein [Verrucomicrobiota bacterium]